MATKTEKLEIADLREKLLQAEELIEAIRNGEIDALVLSDHKQDRVYTLEGADYTYRVLIENMNEGAVILSEDGTVLYCNCGFADMVLTSMENIIGRPITDFIQGADKDRFHKIIKSADVEYAAEEMLLKTGMTVRISFKPFPVRGAPRAHGTCGMAEPAEAHPHSSTAGRPWLPAEAGEPKAFCLIVTDITVLKKNENELKANARQLSRLSSQLTLAEQRERRRLAVIMHDHLQQLLVGAKIHMEILSKKAGQEQRQILEKVLDLNSDALKTARSLSTQMAPQILYERGLGPGLKWLAHNMNETYQLKIKSQIDSNIDRNGRISKFCSTSRRANCFSMWLNMPVPHQPASKWQ